MKCKEFKNAINNDNSTNMSDLDNHLESCKECTMWLDKQIETKPTEMSKAILEAPTLRCRPNIPTMPKHKEEKGLLQMYLSGLKYGLTFGISIMIAISIFGPAKKSHEIKQTEDIASFVSENSDVIPSFLDQNTSNPKNLKEFVTLSKFVNSQLVSFVEDEKIPSFNEENLEELSWLENLSG